MTVSNDALIEAASHAAYETIRAYNRAIGEPDRPPWGAAPGIDHMSYRLGVAGVLQGNGPAESHASWLQCKLADGWTHGPVKDPVKKEHPCMVPYAELPPEQQRKDSLFVAVVLAMVGTLGPSSCPP